MMVRSFSGVNIMKPEQKFRVGGVTATIWKNKSEEGKEFATVQFDRTYKDKEDNWQTTNKLGVNDIPKAMAVLSKAYEYLALKNISENPVPA